MARIPPTVSSLAVVDMGSNSFRLELGRVEGDQIYRLDTWRETLRMGAGLDAKGRLTAEARQSALACLARFGERIEGLHPTAVRAVATNTLRVPPQVFAETVLQFAISTACRESANSFGASEIASQAGTTGR